MAGVGNGGGSGVMMSQGAGVKNTRLGVAEGNGVWIGETKPVALGAGV